MSPSLPSLLNSVPVLPGELLAEKYRVERILGAGGMGVVVAARNVALGKPVAIKMMLPSLLSAPRAVERFEREARAVGRLRSEHVAEVLDIGKLSNGAPYIVMELLEGSDFEELVRTQPLSVEAVVDYVLQACEAVAEAHGLGIVHRDLKARNLFLTRRLDGSPLVKVLDFGISKWASADTPSLSLTRTSDVIGSPSYMSPEQIRSAKDVDARTDIWSLGVIIFELLTGRVPFVAESLPQLCAHVLEQEAPLVSTLRADVPPDLVAIVARCLARAPEERFQTVAELVAALRPLASPSPRAVSTAPLAAAFSRPTSNAPPSPSAPPAVPPALPSARVHVSNGTSISWAETLLDGERSRRRLRRSLLAALPVVALAGVSLAWVASRDRDAQGARPHAADGAAATAVVEPPPPPVPSLEGSAAPPPPPPPSSSADPEPRDAPLPPRPVRPRPGPTTPTGSAGAAPPRAPGSAVAPARSAAKPSSSIEDLLTPADRK